MTKQDAFDRWWQWAEKPVDSLATIPAEIHNPVMALSPEERLDRTKVNDAVRRRKPSKSRAVPICCV